ncbi:E4 protein, partial [Lynx rufus papillomavirus 1]
QHLFPPVPPQPPDLVTPPHRGGPPPVALPRSRARPRNENDPFGSRPLKLQEPDSDDEDKENELPPPRHCHGLPLRLQKKLEDLLHQFQDSLERDLGDFYTTLEIPQCLF